MSNVIFGLLVTCFVAVVFLGFGIALHANGYANGWCQARGYASHATGWVLERPIRCVSHTTVSEEP